MARTDEERRAYGRGYNAGARWPDYRPPFPPEPVVRELMEALRELRDIADTQCATLDPDDDYARAFDKPIDRADAAMAAVGKWLRSS